MTIPTTVVKQNAGERSKLQMVDGQWLVSVHNEAVNCIHEGNAQLLVLFNILNCGEEIVQIVAVQNAAGVKHILGVVSFTRECLDKKQQQYSPSFPSIQYRIFSITKLAQRQVEVFKDSHLQRPLVFFF